MKTIWILVVLYLIGLGLYKFSEGTGVLGADRFVEVALSRSQIDRLRHNSAALTTSKQRKVIYIFSDYECGPCEALDKAVLDRVSPSGEEEIRIIHFPLPQHPTGRLKALYALKISETSEFMKIHRSLFADDAPSTRSVDDKQVVARLEETLKFGRSLKIDSTPTILLVNTESGAALKATGVVDFLTLRRKLEVL